jgi:hypothetical protein
MFSLEDEAEEVSQRHTRHTAGQEVGQPPKAQHAQHAIRIRFTYSLASKFSAAYRSRIKINESKIQTETSATDRYSKGK